MTVPNVAQVFNGFLALSTKEKVQLVEVMNEFFDHLDRRESMREINEQQVLRFQETSFGMVCKCCRRSC